MDKFDISASSNSIIRVVDETYVLIYTQQSVDTGTFLLYQLGDSTALTFRVTNKWEIRDVRIHNGTDAYFCGTSGGTGLIGKFSIWPMFAGTGSISYILCDWTANKYVYPTDLKRLALFEDGGKVCMAMTGSSLWHISHMLPNTTVMSAYWDSFGNCSYHCFCNKDMSMSFTDVACLDEVIVAVGTDPQGEECYMKTFGRQDDFPVNPIDHGKKISIDFERPKGDVLAEYKEGNTVVLSQYNKITSGISTVLYRTEVSPTTGRPTTTAIDARHSTSPSALPFGTLWRMRELNLMGDSAWLLQDAEYPAVVSGMTDWLLQVPLAPITGIAKMWNPLICDAQSMDVLPTKQQPWLSGQNGKLLVYEPYWYYSDGACYKYSKCYFDALTVPWHLLEYDDDDDSKVLPSHGDPAPIFQVDVNMSCE